MIALSCLPLPVRADENDPGFTHIDSDMTEDGAYLLRFRVRHNAMDAFFLASDGLVVAQAFQSPLFSIGSLYRTGLLRICDNPLGYLPASIAWREPTGFRINTSLSGHSRLTVAAHLVPDAITAYIMQKDGRLEQTGLHISATPASWLALDGLLIGQHWTPAGLPDEWLFDRTIRPGGEVYHGTARLRFTVSPFTATVIGGLAVGTEMVPGGFFLVVGSYDFPQLSLALMAGGCSKDYLTLSGGYPDEEIVCAVSAASRRLPDMRLAATLRYLRKRDMHDGMAEAVIKADGKALAAFRVLSGNPLALWLILTSTCTVSEIETLDIRAEIEGWLSTVHRLRLRYSCSDLTRNRTDTLRVEYALSLQRLHLSASVEYDVESGEGRLIQEMLFFQGIYRFRIHGTWKTAFPLTPTFEGGLSLDYTL